ncbi:MAG: hypothetical protein H0W69_03225 [Gemmatimonadaceae bacterium]|nr:hypothetical protein [Gemmatimonadaceae bacterium]
MNAGIIVPLGAFTMVITISVLVPLVRAYAKRIENRSQSLVIPLELTSRLERMEQAIDSIAVEVERISEGQRFTTKLLSEGAKPSAVSVASDQIRNQV